MNSTVSVKSHANRRCVLAAALAAAAAPEGLFFLLADDAGVAVVCTKVSVQVKSGDDGETIKDDGWAPKINASILSQSPLLGNPIAPFKFVRIPHLNDFLLSCDADPLISVMTAAPARLLLVVVPPLSC